MEESYRDSILKVCVNTPVCLGMHYVAPLPPLRSGPGLVKVDLSDFDAVNKFLDETKPDFLVHSAAQRLPDKVAEDFQAAKRLNVEATEALAKKISKSMYCEYNVN